MPQPCHRVPQDKADTISCCSECGVSSAQPKVLIVLHKTRATSAKAVPSYCLFSFIRIPSPNFLA